MRSAVPVLALLLAIGGIAAWLSLRSEDVSPPSTTTAPARHGRTDEQAAAPERTADGPARGVRPAPDGNASPQPAEAPPRADAAPVNVTLRVRAIATQAPVAAFRWRHRTGQASARGEGTAGVAELHLEPGSRGELLVEADGMQPATQELAVPAAGGLPVNVEVFLAAAAVATGISLRVLDPSQQPVANLRVDAFALRAENRAEGAWIDDVPLWSRRTSAADGRYVLPELTPGDYGIRAVAVTDDGTLLPLLPFVRTFELNGSNGFDEHVVLQSGALPRFELVDATGNAIDPTRVGIVGISLRTTTGTDACRRWFVTTNGATASAIDVLPGAGAVSPAQAVPGGDYELRITIGGKIHLLQTVALRAGEMPTLRMLVP